MEMRLENWYFCTPSGTPIPKYDTQIFDKRVCGDVYNHYQFPDGHPIITSRVIEELDIQGVKSVKTRSGSYYRLGAVHSEML